ncbi:SDR family oxidoreductase [Vibrio algarum]|uniref:SDR family oxidoreductase n=1 Tax=Vibrio algarum TaxID=3020714 RepID=A0ABT4YSL7_9VIBR|nr:SDR family oxidoreductase [Vibrio sp. KJ40-1]MDB1124556.1 SDR family oxidoreductase [Vibrio sp. KJ40-1]
MSKTVLITGCSSGIGYVCAHALQKEGFKVIASCRKKEDVERLISEGLTCIQLDLNDSECISNAVIETMNLCNGQLYGLFNNGAYGQTGALEDLPVAALKEQFQSNFFGWHQLVCEILPYMRKQGVGRIVQNSSVLGFAAMKYRGAYNASKFAIEGWSDTLRLELFDTNIKISIIEPGPIETQFRANALLKFQQWIDVDSSVHKKAYGVQLARLGDTTSKNAFVLPAESIVAPLLNALNTREPKLRYRVTTPTKVFSFLKRILPSRWLDIILRKAA